MYPNIVNYILRTHGTDEIIKDAWDEITTFIQAPNKTLSRYVEELMVKTLHSGGVYEEQDCNQVFNQTI